MIQFRYHHGSLAASLATAFTVETKEDLIRVLNDNPFGTKFDDIIADPCGDDERCGWVNQHIVTKPGYGVVGMMRDIAEK